MEKHHRMHLCPHHFRTLYIFLFLLFVGFDFIFFAWIEFKFQAKKKLRKSNRM